MISPWIRKRHTVGPTAAVVVCDSLVARRICAVAQARLREGRLDTGGSAATFALTTAAAPPTTLNVGY